MIHTTHPTSNDRMPGAFARVQPWIASVLVGLMPLSFATEMPGKLLPTVLLVVLGIVLIACDAQVRACYTHERAVVAVMLLAVVYAALNVLGHRLGWRPMDLPTHVLVYLVTAAAFAQPLRMRLVLAMFSLSAILLGGTCIVQHYLMGVERAYGLNGGDWGAIEFAMVMLVLALLALVQLLDFHIPKREKPLHVAGLLFGVYGALLTQSRGPLLAFVPVFVLLLLLHSRRTGMWRWALLLAALVMVTLVASALSLRGQVVDRFAAIGHEVSTYDEHHDAEGSVRERLEMWHTAARGFEQHPLAGVGLDQFGAYVHEQVAAGRSNPSILSYDHPHNEYLDAAATSGVPGLLVLLAVFLVPLARFVRYALDPADELAVPASAGMAVILLYMLCACTDNVFYRAMPHSLYFFLVIGLSLRLAWQRRTAPPAG